MRLLDLFCGAGGAAMGYSRAGFDIVGVDNQPQPRYPFEFVQADALEYLAAHGHEFDSIHASPPCQGYSIMHFNLPWHRDREYPLLILPTMELLEKSGTPYVVENVMGARKGAKNLVKADLETHGLEAGWLCGRMFGLPFYRHRLFATPFLWLAPEHPKHDLNLHPRSERWVYGGSAKGLPGGAAGLDIRGSRVSEQITGKQSMGFPKSDAAPGVRMFNMPTLVGNGAQAEDAAVGHAKGWRLAAEAMGIDWMNRGELTQAIPPAYTEFVGTQLMKVLT